MPDLFEPYGTVLLKRRAEGLVPIRWVIGRNSWQKLAQNVGQTGMNLVINEGFPGASELFGLAVELDDNRDDDQFDLICSSEPGAL